MSDDEWVSRLRERYAGGGMAAVENDPVYDDVAGEDEQPGTGAAVIPHCPACEARPPLAPLAGETSTWDGLLHCPVCYGFWASDQVVAAGLAGAVDHPAAHALEGPRRCRACFGHLKPDGNCAKCGKSRPALVCPACSATMAPFANGPVALDRCGACRWTWFDTGEVRRLYGLGDGDDSGLASDLVKTMPPADAPDAGWPLALQGVAGILRFLR